MRYLRAVDDSRLILDFLAYLELERGLSRNTLAAYRSDLLQLQSFLAEHGKGFTDADHGDLAAYLDSRSAAPSTLQRKLACVRSFYRHLRREDMIDARPHRRPARAGA